MKFAVLTLALLFSFNGARAAMSAEDRAKLKEEASLFAEENTKIREEQMIAIRDLRIEHLKQLYDLKIKHQHEVDAQHKQMVVGNKSANEKIKSDIKEKQEAFKLEEKKFNEDFIEKTLKPKRAEFKAMMGKRREEFKNKRKK